jgi:hypothetical protein
MTGGVRGGFEGGPDGLQLRVVRFSGQPGEHASVTVDDEEVGGAGAESERGGDLAVEIQEERAGALFADALLDAAAEEAGRGGDVGDAGEVGDRAPALFQGRDPGVDFLGAAAVADEEEERSVARELDAVGLPELIGQGEGGEVSRRGEGGGGEGSGSQPGSDREGQGEGGGGGEERRERGGDGLGAGRGDHGVAALPRGTLAGCG